MVRFGVLWRKERKGTPLRPRLQSVLSQLIPLTTSVSDESVSFNCVKKLAIQPKWIKPKTWNASGFHSQVDRNEDEMMLMGEYFWKTGGIYRKVYTILERVVSFEISTKQPNKQVLPTTNVLSFHAFSVGNC